MPTDTEMLDYLIRQGPPGAHDGFGLDAEVWEVSYAGVDGSLPVEENTDGHCIRRAIAAHMAVSATQEPGESAGSLSGEQR